MNFKTVVRDGDSSWVLTLTTELGKRSHRASVTARNAVTGEVLTMPKDRAKLEFLWPLDEWPPFIAEKYPNTTRTTHHERLF